MKSSVRASHLKDDRLALQALGSEVSARVTARLPAGVLETVDEAMRLDWLPVELNAQMADAVYAEAGAAGARTWGRSSMVRALDTPLFRGLVSTAVALFGLSPAAYYKYAPLVWDAIYRDCGGLSTERETPARALVKAGPLPAPLATVAYAEALAGSLEGAFTFCKVAGEVTVETRGPPHVVYVATWRP